VAATILNTQLRTAENGWSFFLRVERHGKHILNAKKRTCYKILHRISNLNRTRQCGLNLCGSISGQLSVLCRIGILIVFCKTGTFIGLQKKNFYSIYSLCDLCINYYKFFCN
jgi:hypothetical protein